jgi:hypothetical protein
MAFIVSILLVMLQRQVWYGKFFVHGKFTKHAIYIQAYQQ